MIYRETIVIEHFIRKEQDHSKYCRNEIRIMA